MTTKLKTILDNDMSFQLSFNTLILSRVGADLFQVAYVKDKVELYHSEINRMSVGDQLTIGGLNGSLKVTMSST